MTQAPVQLVGLGPEPVTVALHGNRRMLLMQPDAVRLEIRAARRKTSTVGGGRQHPAGSAPQQEPGVHWRPYSGRLFPDAVDVPSPTIFLQCVYRCFQHGMLALLLWLHRGAEDQGPLLQVRYTGGTPPSTRGDIPATPFTADRPPFVIADAASVVLADDVAHRPLWLHVTNLEPGPAELVTLVDLMRRQPAGETCWGCLVLVGSLRPGVLSQQHQHREGVQLRGILIRAGEDINPSLAAVEHGWYACVRQGRLWFAPWSRVGGGDPTLSLLPLPHLPSVNLRLWRKGQATFAIGPVRSITTADTQAWDTLLCQQLLEASGGTAPAAE